MKLPPNPRVAITGAGSGLGRAVAVNLARRGAKILVLDVDAARSQETADIVAREGGTAAILRCDVTQLADLEAAAAEMESRFGGIDLLVNNAGVAAAGMVGDIAMDTWEWIMRVNLWGVIHGCHVFVPRMKAQKSGFILNVASCAGIASLPEMGPYNVTKAGVISLSETLQGELAPDNIAVSALCPTFFPTNLLETFRGPDKHHNAAHAFFRRARITADEVAAAGIRGLEKGQLIVIPQADGTAVWLAKRFAPALYYGALRAQQKSPRVARWLGRA